MIKNPHKAISTVGELKASGYVPRSIKEEMRANLILKWQKKQKVFEGIIGFEDTVIPDLERAILSRHNILLLGLRGQAKTKIARLMVELLDEYIPVLEGSEVNEDPLEPFTAQGKALLETLGDQAKVVWMHRLERYVEKLATPDVSVADLIGDIDPIKAATLKLSYADERVIHYGLIPRSHRSVFVINELPDLQPRIQVSLFNILQEKDLQIRGFKWRLPLDIQFVFTANPEDYTNRGSIITPLKDRIESQILTHYPRSIEDSVRITSQEARIHPEQKKTVEIPELHRTLLEMIVFEARESELTDEKSGVSARMSLTAFENLVSTAERRMLLQGQRSTSTRISDFWGIIPSMTGKVELVYEGEQEGPYQVAMQLMFSACKKLFLEYFPNPNQKLRKEAKDEYSIIKAWFVGGKETMLLLDSSDKDFLESINKVEGLMPMVKKHYPKYAESWQLAEMVLFGLSETEVIGKNIVDRNIQFMDPLSNMLDDLSDN